MTARIRSIDYEHDGHALRGELAWDDAWSEPRPCVVVVHDAMKSNQGFEEERAVTLADTDTIGLADLPDAVVRAGRTDALREALGRGEIGFEETVARFEQDLLRDALDRYDWNQTRTAAALGITRRQLKLKMDKHKLGD